MTAIERTAIRFWKVWGSGYAMRTRCAGCGRQRDCRGITRRRMLCLECFDQGPEGVLVRR
ncbi:MAG TPA: hypothetical protein VH834_18125 [Solirubrobacteraceae bacterium]